MKPVTYLLIICCGLLGSCYKPYTARIDSEKKILVVDGMITNEMSSYRISLSYALQFYSDETREPVNSARVYVTDDLDNYYPFNESGNGNYKSDSLKFTGQPGRTYTLCIETPDGEFYMSGPQKLNPVFCPDTVYAEVDYQETLSRFNQILVIILGANILVDVSNQTDTLPHFRFTSNLVKHYIYIINIPPPPFDPPPYTFYCWQSDDANPDVNLASKEYSRNTSSLNRHAVYFTNDEIYVDGRIYDRGSQEPDLSYMALATPERQSYPIIHRILYLNQYSLNNETYLYYKSMDEQLRSEGKIFDPIAVQLAGNINCTTTPGKMVFGFFEASSVSRTSYMIGFRNPRNNQYSIKKIPYIQLSQLNGCWINKVPPFWIN